MELIEEINKLKKKADQLEYYKEKCRRYEEAIQQSISGLTVLITEQVPGTMNKTRTTATELLKVVEEIYEYLMTTDGAETNSDKIQHILEEKNITCNNANISIITKALMRRTGMMSRQEGRTKHYYFFKTGAAK
jgi:hypothetical protein